jgi:hypothetical protein
MCILKAWFHIVTGIAIKSHIESGFDALTGRSAVILPINVTHSSAKLHGSLNLARSSAKNGNGGNGNRRKCAALNPLVDIFFFGESPENNQKGGQWNGEQHTGDSG